MQEALSHLQAMGAVQKLPEDAQWSIRALLMRRLPQATLPRATPPVAAATGAATAAAAAAAGVGVPGGDPTALPQLLGFLLQQMSKVGPDCALTFSAQCGLQKLLQAGEPSQILGLGACAVVSGSLHVSSVHGCEVAA